MAKEIKFAKTKEHPFAASDFRIKVRAKAPHNFKGV